MDPIYRIRSASIVHEIIEGEAIVIDLESGSYCSMEGAAVEVWKGIIEGATRGELIARITECYTGAEDLITGAVTALLDKLATERLIEEADGPADRPIRVPVPCRADRKLFAGCEVQSYTDMKELLALDPIHEVAPAGWPIRKTTPR